MPGAKAEGRAEIGNWLIADPSSFSQRRCGVRVFALGYDCRANEEVGSCRNPPTRRSVFNDPELLAKFPAYPAQLRSLETSKPRPRTPLWNEIENVFGIFLSRANSGELTPEEAMNQANAEIAKIVERNR